MQELYRDITLCLHLLLFDKSITGLRLYVFIFLILCSGPLRIAGQEYIADYMINDLAKPALSNMVWRQVDIYSNTPEKLNRDSLISQYQNALALSRAGNFREGELSALLNLSWCYLIDAAYTQSIEYAHEGIALCRASGNHASLLPFYLSIATASQWQGIYDSATHYYYEVISCILEKKLQESVMLATAYHRLSTIWIHFNDFEQSLYLIHLAEQVCRQMNAQSIFPAVLSNKGIIYAKRKNYPEAEACFLGALRASRKIKSLPDQRNITTNLGCLYMEMDRPKQAILYFREAIRISKLLDKHAKFSITPHYDLGKAYYQMKDYASAEKILAPVIRQARQFDRIEGMEEAMAILSDIYAASGRYKQAYQEQQAYNKLLRQKKDNAPYIRQLEVKYRTAEKDKQLVENRLLIANQEISIIRKNGMLWFVSVGSGILIFVITLFYVHRQRRQEYQMRILKQEEDIRTWQATIKGEETERARIAHELHDSIGGQLSTISLYFGTIRNKYPALLHAGDYTEAMSLLGETLRDVRKTAHNLMPELLLRHGLVDATSIFCKKVQRAHKINIDFQHYGAIKGLNSNFELFLYRIVQELIHNILKHANATEALVQFSMQDHILSITIEDNGKGIQEGSKEIAGMGISSIAARIKGLNGLFTVHSIPGKGTGAYIEFDLKHKKSMLHEN